MSRTPRLLIDAAALIAYLLANNPRVTGVVVHEWLSVGLALILCVHVALNWAWVGHVARSLFSRARARGKIDFVVDVALFAAFTVMMLSGLLISTVVLGVFGLQPAAGGVWRLAHRFSADVSLALLALHFGLHRHWMVDSVKRLFGRSSAPTLETEGGVL